MLPRQQARGPRRIAAHAARRESPRANRNQSSRWHDARSSAATPLLGGVLCVGIDEITPESDPTQSRVHGIGIGQPMKFAA
jgi:hypothetical protein